MPELPMSIDRTSKTLKAIHHRGTEGTEKTIFLLTAPQAQLTK
jgi:hypothetical protein